MDPGKGLAQTERFAAKEHAAQREKVGYRKSPFFSVHPLFDLFSLLARAGDALERPVDLLYEVASNAPNNGVKE